VAVEVCFYLFTIFDLFSITLLGFMPVPIATPLGQAPQIAIIPPCLKEENS